MVHIVTDSLTFFNHVYVSNDFPTFVLQYSLLIADTVTKQSINFVNYKDINVVLPNGYQRHVDVRNTNHVSDKFTLVQSSNVFSVYAWF